MAAPVTFRSSLSRGLAVLVALVALLALAAFVREDGAGALLRTGAPIALILLGAWAVFWNPRAVIDDDGVTLVNVVRTVTIPWPRLRSADSRFALTIETADSRYSAWGVPAGSGFGARVVPRGRRSDASLTRHRALDSTGTAAAAAVEIARRLEDGAAKRSEAGREVSVALHTRTVTALAALAALSAASALLG